MKQETIKLKIFFIVIFFGLFGLAKSSLAATIQAASCNNTAANPDVQNAVDAASDGDTVIVPAGNCTWSKTITCGNDNEPNNSVCITKNIELIGNGIGNTVIQAGGSVANYMLVYKPVNLNSTNEFRLSGFTLDNNNQAEILALGISVNGDGWEPSIVPSHVRVDHNRMIIINDDPSCTNPHLIQNYGVYGSIDNNTMEAACQPFKHESTGTQFWFINHLIDQTDWSRALYIEDNSITLATSLSSTIIDDGQENPPRHVYRYNTITINKPSSALVEMHGTQGPYFFSGFGKDFYGNQITATGTVKDVGIFQSRSGVSFVAFNNVTGDSAWISQAASLNICPASYAAESIIHSSYYFLNRLNNTSLAEVGVDETFGPCAGLSNIPTEGRDFFTDSSNPGITCGTLANLPGTCTTGQGYWETNQSCTSLAGMVGANPSTPISGTLYKCATPNTWTAYYTPYTYPHPLRDESGSDTTPPAAPQGLSVN